MKTLMSASLALLMLAAPAPLAFADDDHSYRRGGSEIEIDIHGATGEILERDVDDDDDDCAMVAK